jgi:DNA polymerase III sliding clamp (beta) subunit (PCNA family)
MEINRKQALQIVRDLEPLTRRAGIPALTGIRVAATPAGCQVVRFTATNLEISGRGTIVDDAGGAGDFLELVPAKPMLEALRASKLERVEFGPADDGTFRVDAAVIRTLPLEDYPEIPEASRTVATGEASEFARAAGAVTPAASGDEARPILTGVFVEISAGRVRFTATDSYRLHSAEFAALTYSADGEKFLIPAETLERAVKTLGRKPTGPVSIAVKTETITRERWAHDAGCTVRRASWYGHPERRRTAGYTSDPVDLEAGCVAECRADPWQDSSGVVAVRISGREFSSRVIEGEFPRYRQLVPEIGGSNVIRAHHGLALVAETIRAAGKLGGRGYFSTPVTLELNGTIMIRREISVLGSYSAEIPPTVAGWDGEDLTVGFNPGYLATALEAFPAGPVWIRDGLKPLMVGTDEEFALVMPVRLPAAIN